MSFKITSTAFNDGDRIPIQYTCEGVNISPPLAIIEPPTGTKSFALFIDDPDARRGVFNHWVLYNLPVKERTLKESLPTTDRLDIGAMQGVNGFGKIGFGGPCPPPGTPHHYHFILFALDTILSAKPGATKDEVLELMKTHVLDKTELVGIYQR